MNKKLAFIFIVLLLAIGFWRMKPVFDVAKVSFKETPTATPVTQKPILKLAVLGDPESDLERLKKALDLAKKNGDEMAVIVGDLTQIGILKQLEEIKKMVKNSPLTTYVIPGNHDLYTSRKETKEPKKYYQQVFGTLYFQLPIKAGKLNLNFLFLDNSEEYQLMEEEQMALIKNSLKQKADLIFVFLHLPIYHPASDYIMGYENEAVSKQKDQLLSIFKEASVSAVFAGHLHHTSSYEWSGIKMYVVGSVNLGRNWQTPRFLEVKILESGKFLVKEIEL